jgi:putative flippase GtrA
MYSGYSERNTVKMENIVKKMLIDPSTTTFQQLVRGILVGGIAALADLSVFSLGVQLLGIHHIVSNSVAFVFGLTVNYLLSREWVFGRKVHHTRRDFLLFSLIGLIGLLISNLLLFVFIDLRLLSILLPHAGNRIMKILAKLLTIILVFLWNFFVRRRVVFAA